MRARMRRQCTSGALPRPHRYLFDHRLVMPEYIIEFQYNLRSTGSCLVPRACRGSVHGEAVQPAGCMTGVAAPLSPSLVARVAGKLQADLR